MASVPAIRSPRDEAESLVIACYRKLLEIQAGSRSAREGSSPAERTGVGLQIFAECFATRCKLVNLGLTDAKADGVLKVCLTTGSEDNQETISVLGKAIGSSSYSVYGEWIAQTACTHCMS